MIERLRFVLMNCLEGRRSGEEKKSGEEFPAPAIEAEKNNSSTVHERCAGIEEERRKKSNNRTLKRLCAPLL